MAICDTCNHEYLDSYDECPFCARRERRRREAEEYVNFAPTPHIRTTTIAAMAGIASVAGVVAYLAVQLYLGAAAVPKATRFAQREACFLTEVNVERAARLYAAEHGSQVTSVSVLVGDTLNSTPTCPAGGTYRWDSENGRLTCSLFGWHGDEQKTN